jgi:predicted RNase H-like HicB family nuclease
VQAEISIPATVRPEIDIFVENAGGNWSAYAIGVPGVAATGATPEECRQEMESALAAHFRFVAREDAEEFAREVALTRAELEAADQATRLGSTRS